MTSVHAQRSSPAGARRSTAPRGPAAQDRRRARRAGRWRLALALLAVLAAAGIVLLATNPFSDAVREITLPLRHEDVIRQQARAKHLDPALIAAVIYQESHFRDRTSRAGAKGLMQLLPGTAKFIAHKTGGTAFELRDLATPQVNIAYGSWYLRYLLRRYDGKEALAVAAYNAGEQNVDRWVRRAGGAERFDVDADVPFTETRNYVHGVLEHRDEYATHYARELGL